MSARLRAWLHLAPVAVAPGGAEASDGDLVRRFADTHDDDAFAELVRRHGPMVLAVCRRVLHPDVHTADDAFQATFLVLATRAAAVSPPERVGAFLHGVAVHVAKKAKAWARKLAPSAPSDLDRVPAVAVEADPDAADVRAKLDDVLAGLPPKYRCAVVLCDLEGRSRAEAAAALGWREGTLSGRLARARKLVAERLARRGVALPAAGLGVLLPASAALASVPGQLAASTVRTATLVAAGATAGDAVPASVAALAQGVPTVQSATYKLLAAGLAGVALALGGFGLYTLTAAEEPAPPPDKPLFVRAAPEQKGWVEKHAFTFKNPVPAVAFGPDLVAAGDEGGVLTLFDMQTGKEKESLLDGTAAARPIDQLQFSPNGAWVYIVTDNRESIHQCSVEKKDRLFPGAGGNGNWKSFGVTADGGYWLQTQGNDLRLVENSFAENVVPFLGKARFKHANAIRFAAADGPDAVATVSASTLRLWATGKDEPLWEAKLEKIDVTDVLVSPGGKLVAVTGDAGQVRIFDAKSGKEVAKTGKLTGAVWSAAFSPDGKKIVAGCEDKTARVYEAETGKELAVLKGHAEAVGAVAFSPGGEMIVTGSADKTVKVWEFRK